MVDGTEKLLLKLTGWEILNIDNDVTMSLYSSIFETLKVKLPGDDDAAKYSSYQQGVANFSLGKVGIVEVYDYLRDFPEVDPKWKNGKIPSPVVFLPATKHYSFPKSLSILGFGEGGIKPVFVDLDTRMDMKKLDEHLTKCLENHIPVMVVGGVCGTTEEGTSDPLDKILEKKKEYAKKGLYFHFHIDGAYGGYFCTLLRHAPENDFISVSSYLRTQLSVYHTADSITFDPHKTGYVPYACGGIIYRNNRLRDNLNFSAPYIYTGAEPNMAIYGVEGSKPGAAVTAVYLSNAVLPLERSGHG